MKCKIILSAAMIILFCTGISTACFCNQQPGKDLFASDAPLSITIKGKVRDVLNNRTGEAKYFPLVMSFKDDDSNLVSLNVNIKTRGHFRRLRTNCFYPPLLIQFNDSTSSHTGLFPSKAKIKLVMPCKGDEYVVREWLVYKIYNLVTDASFRARLVKVNLENEKDKKEGGPFFGMLLEEESQMAKRNHGIIVSRKIRQQEASAEEFLKMTAFEYLVGNTDWSVEFLQNIRLLAKDSLAAPVLVPYDFDHAGIVGAPYALPAEELQMSSVHERRYRGYCINDMAAFNNTITFFNQLKEKIYALYQHCDYIDPKYVKSTVKYLDEFYTTINDPKLLQKEFGYPCDKNGTGNVIIKGLRED